MSDNTSIKLVITADGKAAITELNGVAVAEQRVGAAGAAAGAKAGAGIKQAGSAAEAAKGQAESLAAAYATLATAVGAVAGAGSIMALAGTADDVRILRDRVKAIVGDSGDWQTIWQEIYRISQANGVAIADTVQLYQRLSISADRLGASTRNILDVVQAVQQLGRMGGSTADEIRNASIQFAQMLNSPMAQAEELNSILDGMPMLAKEIEQGLKLVPGSLKQAVLAGLDTKKIFDALLQRVGDIDRRAQQAAGSISQALTAMGNTLGAGLNALDEAAGGAGKSWTARWADGVKEIARRLDGLVQQFRGGFVASEAGVDPRLQGQARLNALMERYNALWAQAEAAQTRWQEASARSGIMPGAARQAALAAAEIKRLQAAIDTVADAIQRTRSAMAAATPDLVALNQKATQAALATANAIYTQASGFQKLKADVADVETALKGMNAAIKGPAPAATVGDQLREIIGIRDQAEAALKTGDMATATSKVEAGAKAIQEFIKAGGIADGTIGSLAMEFEKMGAAMAKGAKNGKDALDAAAKAMKVDLTVRPVLDEKALAEITAKLKAGLIVTPEDLRAAGLVGADKTTSPTAQSDRARIVPGDGSTEAGKAANAMMEAASQTVRKTLEQAVKAPFSIKLDAAAASADVVKQVQAALAAAKLTVAVTAVVTEVSGGGAAPSSDGGVSKAADKTGTMQG